MNLSASQSLLYKKPPSINGAVASNTTSGASTSVTLPVALANDIVILCVVSNGGQPTVVTSPNLVWAQHATDANVSNLEVWWARASATLINESITCTPTSAVFTAISALCVSGAKVIGSPWDTNSSLPFTHAGAGSDPCTVSTTSQNSMILGFWRADGTALAAGAGYTLFLNGTSPYFTAIEYKIVGSPQTSLTVDVSPSGHANGGIASAIVRGP